MVFILNGIHSLMVFKLDSQVVPLIQCRPCKHIYCFTTHEACKSLCEDNVSPQILDLSRVLKMCIFCLHKLSNAPVHPVMKFSTLTSPTLIQTLSQIICFRPINESVVESTKVMMSLDCISV